MIHHLWRLHDICIHTSLPVSEVSECRQNLVDDPMSITYLNSSTEAAQLWCSPAMKRTCYSPRVSLSAEGPGLRNSRCALWYRCDSEHVWAKKGDPVSLPIVTCRSKTVGNKKLWQTEIEVHMTKPFFKGLKGMMVKLDETLEQSCFLPLIGRSNLYFWVTSLHPATIHVPLIKRHGMIHAPNPDLLVSYFWHRFPLKKIQVFPTSKVVQRVAWCKAATSCETPRRCHGHSSIWKPSSVVKRHRVWRDTQWMQVAWGPYDIPIKNRSPQMIQCKIPWDLWPFWIWKWMELQLLTSF